MAIYIDSAIIAEVEAARSLGWVSGVTTNPVLLAKSGGEAREVLSALARLNMSSLFYQLVSPTVAGMFEEKRLAAEIVGPSLVIKVPPTENAFRFVAQCREVPCCVTAVFHPAQALIASEVNARYVAVYVNRATRLMGDGLKLVKDVAEILKHSQTEIIAASLKSSEEACASLSVGAHHLTLPYEVLVNFTMHQLTEQALAEFRATGVGIPSPSEKELRSV